MPLMLPIVTRLSLDPVAFIASAAAIAINTVWLYPGRAAIGIGLVALSVPIYWFWRRNSESVAGSRQAT